MNIIQILREIADIGTVSDCGHSASICGEAADEIERLVLACADHMSVRSELRQQNVEFTKQLQSIAAVAHCGGLACMSQDDALTAIRRVTLPHFDKSATDEQHLVAIANCN